MLKLPQHPPQLSQEKGTPTAGPAPLKRNSVTVSQYDENNMKRPFSITDTAEKRSEGSQGRGATKRGVTSLGSSNPIRTQTATASIEGKLVASTPTLPVIQEPQANGSEEFANNRKPGQKMSSGTRGPGNSKCEDRRAIRGDKTALATQLPKDVQQGDVRRDSHSLYKKPHETRAQTIERMQKDQLREINTKIRHKPHFGEEHTTALATLDMLRRDISAGSSISKTKHTIQNQDLETIQHDCPPGLSAAHSPSSANFVRGKENIALAPSQQGGSSELQSGVQQRSSRIPPSEQYVQSANQSKTSQLAMSASRSWKHADLGDLSGASSDSMHVAGYARLPKSDFVHQDAVNWGQGFIPPPVEWEQRHKFDRCDPTKISSIHGWVLEMSRKTFERQNTYEFSPRIYPVELVKMAEMHADGIGLVRRETMVNRKTAEYFGYSIKDCQEVFQYPFPAVEWDQVCKLDLRQEQNVEHKDETAQDLIDAALRRLRNAVEAIPKMQICHAVQAPKESLRTVILDDAAATVPTKQISANVYLRPAVQEDMPQLVDIFNHYVANSARTSEIRPVTREDMQFRFRLVVEEKLPFIVAVERTRKNARLKARRRRVNPNHPVQNIDNDVGTMIKDETILGWASATDWTAAEFAESITVELELYVRPDHRDKGVGTCLMDALLCSTDKGYMTKGGYTMHCAPEVKYLYTCGGWRLLHKLYFNIRVFNQQMSPEQNWQIIQRGRGVVIEEIPKPDFGREAKIMDREDDYQVWIKGWLESWNFEEEARLTKTGAREGRYIDSVLMSRETNWRPNDGEVPSGAVV